jgi:hypothetical protein
VPIPPSAPTAGASPPDEPAQAAPAPARSGADGDHIPEDAELSYATLPADFWGDEGGVELAPPEGEPAFAEGEQERPAAPEADAPGDEQETEEPLLQAFAELQRLFPGRVIEVVAPPAEAEGAFDDASAVSPDDAPHADEDDEVNDDGNDEPDGKTQPAISFVPSPDEA